MSLGKKQELFSRNLNKLITWIYANTDFEIRRGETQRPLMMQKYYVSVGKSWTLNGAHLKKLAADLFFSKDGKMVWSHESLKEVGEYWKSLHPQNEWGGDWQKKDVPHFEMKA